MKTPAELIPDASGRISKALFAYWFEILSDRWPNQAPKLPANISLFLEMLREDLTAGRFDTAARAAFKESTFFPSPRALIDYGYGDIEREAADAWAEIMAANIGGHDVLTLEGSRSRKLLARQGGSAAVKKAEGYALEAMRKRFLADWVADVRAELQREARAALERHEAAKALAEGAAPVAALPEQTAEPLPASRRAAGDAAPVPAKGKARNAFKAALRTVEGDQ